MAIGCCDTHFFFFQAEDGIRDYKVTGVQTCALPIYTPSECSTRTPWSRLEQSATLGREICTPAVPCWLLRERLATPLKSLPLMFPAPQLCTVCAPKRTANRAAPRVPRSAAWAWATNSSSGMAASAPPFPFPFQFCDAKTSTDRKSTRLNSSHLVISYAVF